MGRERHVGHAGMEESCQVGEMLCDVVINAIHVSAEVASGLVLLSLGLYVRQHPQHVRCGPAGGCLAARVGIIPTTSSFSCHKWGVGDSLLSSTSRMLGSTSEASVKS